MANVRTKNKSTPGPWDTTDGGVLYTRADGYSSIANVRDIRDFRLIASAPDLLLACKEALRFLPSGGTAYNLLWKAIEKAERKTT